MANEWAKMENLIGVALAAVEGLEVESDEVWFRAEDGREWRMYHSQDCCESVRVEEVVGDPEDLVGSPVLFAEESVGGQDEPTPDGKCGSYSWTWTFYTMRTQKGTVSFRWLGESNGYYGEGVDFVRVDNEKTTT